LPLCTGSASSLGKVPVMCACARDRNMIKCTSRPLEWKDGVRGGVRMMGVLMQIWRAWGQGAGKVRYLSQEALVWVLLGVRFQRGQNDFGSV